MLNNKAVFCYLFTVENLKKVYLAVSFQFNTSQLDDTADTVHTAEKEQIKYFTQKQLGKITFFYVQTAALLSCYCHKLCLFKFVESCK